VIAFGHVRSLPEELSTVSSVDPDVEVDQDGMQAVDVVFPGVRIQMWCKRPKMTPMRPNQLGRYENFANIWLVKFRAVLSAKARTLKQSVPGPVT